MPDEVSADVAAFYQSLELSRKGLDDLIHRGNPQLEAVIDYLYGCRGKVILSGMGKCGFIAMKLAATLSSTGTPAIFLHPAEAIHGDLGIAHEDDVAVLFSNSGETSEVVELAPLLRHMRLPLIAMTGRPDSTLARKCDAVINTTVAREADPLNIAPTASTTVMLAAGDALAAVLMEKRRFTEEDYARFHPGGSLGQRLLRTVESLMHQGDELPLTPEDRPLREAIFDISRKRLGVTVAVDDQGRMSGILTDGDLRRIFEQNEHPLDLQVCAVMTRRPRVITPEKLALDALQLMEDNRITSLAVLDEKERVCGLLHLHDILRAGISL